MLNNTRKTNKSIIGIAFWMTLKKSLWQKSLDEKKKKIKKIKIKIQFSILCKSSFTCLWLIPLGQIWWR